MYTNESKVENFDLLDKMIYKSKLAMAVTLILGILSLLFSFGAIAYLNQGFTPSNRNYLRVQALQSEVLRIDDILTMSSWVASMTADQYWQQRYHTFVPILNQKRAELTQLSPPNAQQFIRETNAANRILLDYEIEAIKAASHNNKDYALLLLTSSEYTLQKTDIL